MIGVMLNITATLTNTPPPPFLPPPPAPRDIPLYSKTLGFSLGLDYREAAMVITAKNSTK